MADLSALLPAGDGTSFIGGGWPAAPMPPGGVSAGRRPVCLVRVNNADSPVFGDGVTLPVHLNALLTGVLEAEVVNNNYYSADTFRVLLALKDAPRWFDVNYLGAQEYIPLEVIMGTSENDLLSLIQGVIDDFEYNPVENTVELRGRDYSRFFIDARTVETWPSKTASQIVATLAARRGLGTALITPTSLPIGTAPNSYQTLQGDGRTEWDLLTWLAGQSVDADGNSFVVYARGSNLYFGPRPTAVDYTLAFDRGPGTGQPLRLNAVQGPLAGPRWGGLRLTISRNISVLRNVVVQLQSAQAGAQQSLLARFPVNAPAGPVQLYAFTAKPGLSQDSLQQQARARQQDISRHELRLDFSLPGDSVLTPASLVNVTGLADSLTQSYFVQSVTRRFSADGGYVMDCTAQNRAVVAGS